MCVFEGQGKRIMRDLIARTGLILESRDEEYIEPDKFNLSGEYSKLNKMLFGGKLGFYPIKWNNRKASGGLVNSLRKGRDVWVKDVQISKFYRHNLSTLRNTLAHEMIHVFLIEKGYDAALDSHKHGRMFKHEMKRINGLGKGFNIVIDEVRQASAVRKNAKKKKYGVLLVEGPMGDGFLIFNEKVLKDIYDELLSKPIRWLERFKFRFYHSMEDGLGAYPVKRKLGKGFGYYPDEDGIVGKVKKDGMPFAEILNGQGRVY